MKKLFNLLLTFILMATIVFVYIKIDVISAFLKDFFVSNKTITIGESNEYKRNYDFISFTNDEDYVPMNENEIINIYYNVLNNGWEEFTFYCPEEYKNCVKDVDNIANDNVLISKVNGYVSPFNSFSSINTKVSSTGEVHINVEKNYSPSQIKMIDKRVNEILEELNIDSFSSDEEKISAIQNYIVRNVKYDEEATANNESPYLSNTAYGSLVQGYATCSGYSDAIALFLDKIKIPNLKINSENHVWNLVFVSNSWKHLDVTWNDSDKAIYKDKYFLVTTEEILKLDPKEHNYDKSFYLEILN